MKKPGHDNKEHCYTDHLKQSHKLGIFVNAMTLVLSVSLGVSQSPPDVWVLLSGSLQIILQASVKSSVSTELLLLFFYI